MPGASIRRAWPSVGGYDPKKPAPVVLALHGAAMNGPMMVWFSGLDKTSDKEGFIVVYPSGTGTGPFLTWNAGGFKGKMAEGKADDVAFIGKLLDDLDTVVKMDEKRVYACGMSNGGMMCYRLAAELSDRIAAVDTKSRRLMHWLLDPPPGDVAEGSTPEGLALSADGTRLYAAEADANAVAVFELSALTSA